MNLQNYFALLLVLLICLLSGANSRFRISNGAKVSKIEDRPYMVSLHDPLSYFCAGSLVNMETVITAAHCVNKRKEHWVTVRAGGTSIEGPKSSKVRRFIKPETFDEETNHMDIAAIKLCSPFTKSSKIQAIPLCSTTLQNFNKMWVSGWGAKSAGSSQPSDSLQTIVLDIISNPYCAQIYEKARTLTSSMICARGAGDTCRGDSGAPGVVNGKICTVTSNGMKSGDPRFPGIYTNLNDEEVLNFVQESMKPELEGADSFLSGLSAQFQNLFH